MTTHQQQSNHSLAHHRLRVWDRAIRLCQLVHRRPVRDAELRRQAGRAAKSVALNIAEGAAQEGAARGRHFTIAKGSVSEVVAAYEIADAIGESVPLADVAELGNGLAAMLARLVRPRR